MSSALVKTRSETNSKANTPDKTMDLVCIEIKSLLFSLIILIDFVARGVYFLIFSQARAKQPCRQEAFPAC